MTAVDQPIIEGDNLYAPELVRQKDGWCCYYGGWKTKGQLYDRIYLGVSTSNDIRTTSWSERLAITNGDYRHVNDPTVVQEKDDWIMLYTAAGDVWEGDGLRFRDWINFSTSKDGLTWSPDAGTTSTEINMEVSAAINEGRSFSDIARPSLVRTKGGWKLWFDGKVNGGPIESYLAECDEAFPRRFKVIHKYANVAKFPGFMEPDVAILKDGSYVAVVQRGFKQLHFGTSQDGIHFSLNKVLDVTHNYSRQWVSNPGLVYDDVTDELLGLGFGMTDDHQYMNHDIGFTFTNQ